MDGRRRVIHFKQVGILKLANKPELTAKEFVTCWQPAGVNSNNERSKEKVYQD
jgi:hypothetical protein